jgi:hypothetical protein
MPDSYRVLEPNGTVIADRISYLQARGYLVDNDKRRLQRAIVSYEDIPPLPSLPRQVFCIDTEGVDLEVSFIEPSRVPAATRIFVVDTPHWTEMDLSPLRQPTPDELSP